MQNYSGEYPDSLLPSLRGIPFICPLCRGQLDVRKDAYHCPHCKKFYPLHGGIPDFRVFPDPFLDFQGDYDRTEIILAAIDHHDFKSLLEYYWSMSDVTPEVLRPKFIRSAMLGEQKARRILGILEDSAYKESVTAKSVLEIGSGTGNFLSVAMLRYGQVTGIDIAMRWLHVSRRRFMDSGLPVPPLVCCCAEYLPFPDGMFDLAVASATLEFVCDQNRVLSECARCLKDNGSLYVSTVNRFSIAQDPYAYLLGVGFLPRAWQALYVRWRSKAIYDNIQLLSFHELNQMAAKYFATRKFFLPNIDNSSLHRFPLFTRLQVRLYRQLRKLPLFRLFLKWFGPGWDAIFCKQSLT